MFYLLLSSPNVDPVTDTADVKFVVDSSGHPTVRAATLDRLIERMTGLRDPGTALSVLSN